jgi:hypothetical protein
VVVEEELHMVAVAALADSVLHLVFQLQQLLMQ